MAALGLERAFTARAARPVRSISGNVRLNRTLSTIKKTSLVYNPRTDTARGGLTSPAGVWRDARPLHGHFYNQRFAAASSTDNVGQSSPSGAEEEAAPSALCPESLQKFFESNCGRWRGDFVQFDLQGRRLQKIPIALTATSFGKGDLCSLHQTLQVRPGPISGGEDLAGTPGSDGGPSDWVQWTVPEMNRFTADNRQQVGFFEEEGAYVLSHPTAEMLSHVLRVGIAGDGDADDPGIKGVRMPSRRPALVSEACLYGPKTSAPPPLAGHSGVAAWAHRVRAFLVLDPRGVMDTIAIFAEEKAGETAPSSQVGAFDALEAAGAERRLEGTWGGTAQICRSDLYGGTREEQSVTTTYSLSGPDTLLVTDTRGSRTIRSRAVAQGNVVVYDGGLQTTFLPGGLSLTFPQVVARGSAFFFEFQWAPPGATWRRRIVRTFDPDGMVVSTAFISQRLLGTEASC